MQLGLKSFARMRKYCGIKLNNDRTSVETSQLPAHGTLAKYSHHEENAGE